MYQTQFDLRPSYLVVSSIALISEIEKKGIKASRKITKAEKKDIVIPSPIRNVAQEAATLSTTILKSTSSSSICQLVKLFDANMKDFHERLETEIRKNVEGDQSMEIATYLDESICNIAARYRNINQLCISCESSPSVVAQKTPETSSFPELPPAPCVIL